MATEYIKRNGKFLVRNGKLFERAGYIPNSTYPVTFTVKEWFLDPDNSFTDTEVEALPFMTVKIGSTTKLTNGLGQVTFNLPPDTYTYEVYDMVRYLTTRKGNITVVDAAVSVDEKIYACLYTPTQVNAMIANDGYIPVASATELDGLRNATGRRMGQGTIHDTVSDVVTGLGKNYVQVRNLDLISFSDWQPIGGIFLGILDGNGLGNENLTITSLGGNVGLIGVNNGILRNINIYGNVSGANNVGLLCGVQAGVGSRTENCNAFGTVTGRESISLLVGSNGTPSTPIGGNVINCKVSGNINGTSNAFSDFAGICSYNYGDVVDCEAIVNINEINITASTFPIGGICSRNYKLIQRCIANVDITSDRGRNIGGIVGSNLDSNALVEYCSATGNIKGNEVIGGVCGFQQNSAKCQNSKSDVDLFLERLYASVNTTILNSIGGVIASQRNSAIALNCFSSGTITIDKTARPSDNINTGGFCGVNTATITNSYYDSDTSGQSDTGKGLPRTTAQLKNGTADSFINPDGTTDLTEDPANAMFTGWDALIWDFTDTNNYPELL